MASTRPRSRMQEIRQARKLSQIALVRATGIKQSIIWKTDSGRQRPSIKTAAAIAAALGVQEHNLFEPIGARIPKSAHEPVPGEVVDDPAELAWLRFWRILTDSQRLEILLLLQVQALKKTA